jgi:hypothetical protein
MMDLCMHRLHAFPHSKREAVLYVMPEPRHTAFTPLDSEAVKVYALTHSPLSCFRAYCSVLVAATISSQRNMSQAAGSLVNPICLVLTNWEFGALLPVLALILPRSRPVGLMIYK